MGGFSRSRPGSLAKRRDAQLEAFARWGIPDPSQLARLAAITHPTFVAGGDNDTMMITENSSLLAHHLPNAQLRIYPDSGHGSSTGTPSSSPTTSARSSTVAEGARTRIDPGRSACVV